jgi:peptide/nickel transport system ATP-binding protein
VTAVASDVTASAGHAHLRPELDPLLQVEDLVVEFPVGRRNDVVHAVSGVSFDVLEGETVGLVGESGCGKSTTGRGILQLPRPTSGSVVIDGVDLGGLDDAQLRRMRPQLQLILQDSISSLNPRRKVFDIVARGLRVWNRGGAAEIEARVHELLEAVGLDPDQVGQRRPHELSGGQCQRVCIARAVALDPKVLICDEPVSSLDVSVQAQILNLLRDMKDRYGLTMVFISHDLGVVKNVSDRVVVMYLGKVCEVGPPDEIYARPAHHYTDLLIRSILDTDPASRSRSDASETATVTLPSPIDPPSGCRFRTRCPRATDRCAAEEPELRSVGPDQYVACHFPLEHPVELAAAPAGAVRDQGVR